MSRRGLQLIRSHARRVVLLLAAFVILVGVVRGGTRFFYCPMTQLASDTPPCTRGHDDANAAESGDPEGPALQTPDCCDEKWRAAAPIASVPDVHAASVPPRTLVALLPTAPRGMAIVAARMPFGIAQRVRAGPSPPRASERRAELMVFNN